MTSMLNVMKIYHLVQKLLVGDRDGQTGDIISLLLIFKGEKDTCASNYT
jgi:hypothetical protein